MARQRFFSRLFGGSNPPPQADSAPQPAPPVAAPPPPPVPPVDFSDERIPDTSRGRIEKLLAIIASTEAAATNEPAWCPILVELQQLREKHLPILLRSYIEIPAAHRAEVFRKTGRSASFALNEALDKMIERLNTLSQKLAQGNIDAFTSNLRFIDMRYGEDRLSAD